MAKRGSAGNTKKTTSSRSASSYSLESMVGCSDMVLLDPLTESNLVQNLKKRYDAGEIYTYIGHVVISVNPYSPLSIYSPEYVNEYRSRNFFELPPHIFAISDSAYRSMRDMHQDQCVIISGESGAGKTEASKRVMEYLAQVSGKGQEVDKIKEQLLQSNPVLEAFGNAKTNRNDNSSRFGKYMDIEFDFKGDPVGGIVTNYLLEKSRVIGQAKGERNFHIFFQILAGLPDEFLNMLHLQRDTGNYEYLSKSECCTIQSVDDTEQFDVTMKAMEVIGFSADEISTVLELLAAILNLGNIKFEGYSLPNGTIACNLDKMSKNAVSFACDMLGCSVELLDQCLTKKSVETSRDTILTPHSAVEGALARDGLSKAIYDRLFTWIVRRINDSIKSMSLNKRKSMGVLDIYGFEIFETNSFEQFMINYCNERLQQLFVDLTLCTEQHEYIREGIEWETVEYFDNSVICELIEDPTEGILALLDEECLRPGEANDNTFLDRLNKTCLSHDHYISRESREHLSDHTITRDQFRLVHYAGEVTYHVEGFLDKNKDKLFKDLSQAMFACERGMLKKLFPEGDPDAAHLKRPSTTGHQFKSSVCDLMKNLLSKNPNYIRCIKPNTQQRPRKFDNALVAAQSRYLGLLENIRVRRAGYAFRLSYNEALERYKMLSTRTWPKWKRSPKDGIKAIMVACGKNPEEFSMGRTKIFIRTPTTVFDLEERRKKRMVDLAVLIQKVYRGWILWKKFQNMRKAQIMISKKYRGLVCRKKYQRTRNAIIVIQKYFRGWQVRLEVKNLRYMAACTWASFVIRRYFFSWKLQKEINERVYAKKALPAAMVIQAYYRGWQIRKRLHGMKVETAGPVVARFIKRALVYRFLIQLSRNLPSRSPLDKRWPRCSPLFRRTSIVLRKMYHQWRCKLLRNYYNANPRDSRRLVEKARASALFRGKKAIYSRTVAVPFKQDHIGLRGSERWARLATKHGDQRIVWANNVQKLNKSDIKLCQRVLVVTAASLFLLDPKSFSLQYHVPLTELEAISVSPHIDHFLIIHLRPSQSRDKTAPKGDFIFQVSNVIEVVTKTIAVVQEVEKRSVKFTVTEQVSVRFRHGADPTNVRFQPSAGGILSTSPLCRKKGNTLTISVTP